MTNMNRKSTSLEAGDNDVRNHEQVMLRASVIDDQTTAKVISYHIIGPYVDFIGPHYRNTDHGCITAFVNDKTSYELRRITKKC